ncbi:MAG: 16S rRNA (cytosine(1402)-N(4))-methyltransferase RsmH [Verrucomicrobiota bacterium JB023]|nr:16S rRNA (cytosine(1402)-N(4))-methyltransferase RsmH [Verrucomicrobiota bacterium JB023]
MLTPASIPALAGEPRCLAGFSWGKLAMPEWRELAYHSRGEGDNGASSGYHVSVLREETIAVFGPLAGKRVLDGTLGGGGHSQALLAAGASVIGLDRDEDALAYASRRLEGYGDRFRAVHLNFSQMEEAVEPASLDGVLLDLGVSSWQLDEAERGFSFQKDGPLDMRMDRSKGETAADLVNTWAEEDLANVFYRFGEEKASRKIAAAIAKARQQESFTRTLQLADCVASAMGGRGRKHPATRVFQALRIAVNAELDEVEKALRASLNVLKPGGVLAVITFHSLEDRLVKNFMRDRSRQWLDRPEWPEPRPNPDWALVPITRKAVSAGAEELAANPRSRSAHLRAAKLKS